MSRLCTVEDAHTDARGKAFIIYLGLDGADQRILNVELTLMDLSFRLRQSYHDVEPGT